ncbi:FimV/HubP family polar landmark protein [Arsukibacterium sp.]|uniref:FimV/HubP family polar landmark protein n=1 Tax=Arsukibacterium sp. TaxID=1977258 RepID=UPI003569A94E
MPLRLLSLLLVVNFSALLAASAFADEPASTPLRGPKSADTALMQRQLGPLSATDTLWRIAEQVKPEGANVSTYQVMYAIYLKNPQAFIDGNLNHLRPGSTIQLPQLREIRLVDNNVARAKSDADDRAWAARASRQANPQQNSAQQNNAQQAQSSAVSAAQLQQLTELKDQFGNSLLMIEAIARENNQLKSTLTEVQTELLALQQQLGEDSSLQQQLNTLLKQQADILAAQQAQEQQAAEAAKLLATEQEQSASIFNNPITWVLAASIPALIILSLVVLWLKRRGQQTEAAVVAATSSAVPPADYKSPLPPLDDNDADDSGLFDIDESLLDDAFADSGDFGAADVLDDSLPDFNDDALLDDSDLLDDDILLDDDSLLSAGEQKTTAAEDDLLNDVLGTPELTDEPAASEFDANNILSDSDLNALLLAEDDDDTIIELDEDEFDLGNDDADISVAAPQHVAEDQLKQELAATEDEDVIEFDEQDMPSAAAEPVSEHDLLQPDQLEPQEIEEELLEEIELDLPDDSDDSVPMAEAEHLAEPVTELDDETDLNISEDEHILVETDNDSEALVNEQFASELSNDEFTDAQISNLVEDQNFDRTELDAFAESLALEDDEQREKPDVADDDQASELLSAELDELLQQVAAAEPESTPIDGTPSDETATDTAEADADELADDNDTLADNEGPDNEGPDLQNNEDDSVSKPSEAALSVENPSKILDSYPDLELTDEEASDDDMALPADSVSVSLAAADPEADQSLAKLDDSQFDNLLTELEAMAQTTANDSEELSLDVDSVFNPATDDESSVALSDDDFVEIDNLLASTEQAQQDDGRFEQLNVDVGLDEFADVIGNDNPQDVDKEDNGYGAKLDLVRAYIEIDDLESASHIITEMLDSDAPEHVKTEAKALQLKTK